jgi:hypothetical protein
MKQYLPYILVIFTVLLLLIGISLWKQYTLDIHIGNDLNIFEIIKGGVLRDK